MRIYLGRPFKGEPCFQGKSSSGKPFFPIRAYHCSFFFFSRKLSFQESLFFWRTFFRRAFFRRIFFFQPDLFQGHLVFRRTFFLELFFPKGPFFQGTFWQRRHYLASAISHSHYVRYTGRQCSKCLISKWKKDNEPKSKKGGQTKKKYKKKIQRL